METEGKEIIRMVKGGGGGMNDKIKEKAGVLYCDLKHNLFLEDVAEIIRKEYGVKVSTAEVSKWINEYIRENLRKLTKAQKDMLVIKRVLELNGNTVDYIVEKIRKEWGYGVKYIKVFNLISSYKKIKNNEEMIKEMFERGIGMYAIAENLDVPKDMIKLLFRRGRYGK